MKNKNSWLILVFFIVTIMMVGTFKYTTPPNIASAQEQQQETPQENTWISYAELYSYCPLLTPKHPDYKAKYEAEREKLKEMIEQVGEKNVTIEIRGEETFLLEINYQREGVRKTEYKVFDPEKKIWHAYPENPFLNADTKELYVGEPATDTVLFIIDIFTLFQRGSGSDFIDHKKGIGAYRSGVAFYNENAPLFRKLFRFFQAHEDTEINRLAFCYEFLEDYQTLSKENQKAIYPSSSFITGYQDLFMKLKSLEGDKTKLTEEEIKRIEQSLKSLDGYYKEWLGIREVLKQMPPEDQARVKDFAELLDLYDLN